MYRAKADGRAGYAVFDPAMQAQLVARLALEQDLHQALARDQFVLHYQPIVDLRSGRVVKAEALVRWKHPTRGLVSPGVFVALAEETGLIRPLGRWVLEQACRQARAWQALLPAGRAPMVSVNLTAREFQDPELAAEVARLLRATDLPPELLELEITEGAVMEDAPTTLQTLLGLKRLGVQLAIDDFGTGYSSLAYLKRFPVDTLKIDRSFVSGPGADTDDLAIVEAILTVAHTLGLRVTAEGVETAAQVQRFAQLGCALAQGYHFSRPVAADELTNLLQRHAALGVPSRVPTQRLSPTTTELRLRRTARTRRFLLPTTGQETD
jgi:Amt family ammonium transporter